MTEREKIQPNLTGVPETLLWPLWNRAMESRRSDAVLHDPMAEGLIDRIDYDFQDSFGKPNALHAIRARVCDGLIAQYVADTLGKPVVVSLGEGLETQFWRIGKPDLRWISVDVQSAIALRRALLPYEVGNVLHAGSAFDPSWWAHVPDGSRPFISASGLLMYFSESEVAGLLGGISENLPGASIFFDTIPPFFAKKSLSGMKVTKTYQAPPMPWGIRLSDIPAFVSSCGSWQTCQAQGYGDIVPRRTPLYSAVTRMPGLRNRLAGGLVFAKLPN